MRRLASPPRPDWATRVESQGLHFHTHETGPYWDESAYYEFTREQIEEVESATEQLHAMGLAAAKAVIEGGRLAEFGIPEAFHPWIRRSWDQKEATVYGRFDLSYDGRSPPKLLEYNADTPTALLEAAVVQWFWLQDAHPDDDQFNSIHERLIDAWKAIHARGARRVHFAAIEGHSEDYWTVQYLRDAAQQAGLEPVFLEMGQIGFDRGRKTFVGALREPITVLFKLYPWEWLLDEEFGPLLPHAPTRWVEPAWKMVLSHKAILPVLWEMFPDSPHLLPASREPLGCLEIRKPLLGREGSNVAWLDDGRVVRETDGPYAEGPFVYQRAHPLPNFGGRYPVVGSWLVNGVACGLGVREDGDPTTRNLARFVPHLFVES